jgi:predicted RNase H-like HicB family nuclease
MEILLAIQKDENSTYGVVVPAIKGCFSWGDTIDEAVKNTREAIELHLETSLETNSEINIDSVSLEDVQRDYEGSRFVYIDIDENKLDRSPERINISVPRFVLKKIDNYVDSRHESRSGFIARAALRTIADEQQDKEESHA